MRVRLDRPERFREMDSDGYLGGDDYADVPAGTVVDVAEAEHGIFLLSITVGTGKKLYCRRRS